MTRQLNHHPIGTHPLVITIVLFLAVFAVGNVLAAGRIYLADDTDNDTAFVTTGIGSEFNLKLMADAGLLDFHLYIVDIAYDKTILDTVEINDDGSLFQALGTTVIFSKYLREDSTILRIQAMTFGAGVSADGPGLLATIRLKAIGTGMVDMNIVAMEVRDVYNNLMTDVTGDGATVLIDVPPSEFNLLDPTNMEQVDILIVDDLHFEWEAATSAYPGDFVEYELSYGTDPAFLTNTTIVGSLVNTWFDVAALDLQSAIYFWKVRAYNSYGFETWSIQTNWYFDLTIIGYPGNFSLVEPLNETIVNVISGIGIFLDWTDSETLIPNDTLTYSIYCGPDNDLPGSEYYSTEINDISEIMIDDSHLPLRESVYWQVKATNKLDYSTESDNILSFLAYIRGDTDGDDEINILDIVYLINYKYKDGPEPFPYEAGNADCEIPVNILDIVYLINYKYKGGPPPCDN